MLKATIPVVAILLLVPAPASRVPAEQIATTAHQPLPSNPSDLWLVPAAADVTPAALTPYKALIDGAADVARGDYAGALPLVSQASLASTELRDYAAYYAALSQLRLSRSADARARFHALRERKPQGALSVTSALGEAEAAEALGDYKAAVDIYEELAEVKTTVNEDVLSRLARAHLGAGDKKKAAEAYLRVYYEFPLTDAAIAADTQLESLRDQVTRTAGKSELGRAQILYGARRYPEARAAFASIQGKLSGDDRELADLRIAECDFFLKRYAAARDGVQPYLDSASRKAEARFFALSAQRELGKDDEFVAATRRLVDEFPDSSWSEEALNNLGTYYILTNEDELAAKCFRELYEKFPNGTRAERAAWKYGWYQYKIGEYAETVRVFESAASIFARGDYRPSFLYWAARAHGKMGNGSSSSERFRVVQADYGNSYYGRLANQQLASRADQMRADAVPANRPTAAAALPPLPTDRLIRLLLAAGLYDDALSELRFATRTWGQAPAIDATIAWVYYRKGELRRAITLMRRAYPQHLTSYGQELPPEILQVIFPLTYWDWIRKYSAPRNLDPYVVAALIAQESTFDAKIRSSANAWGLMQIVPATGRRLARTLGITRFSTPVLTNPETNIKLGTLYFSKLVEQFGGTHYALASYNAGESRVVRWRAERPGLDQDEFIDDIPFPETQNYVKRILGTAEDYRMLYGKGGGRPIPVNGDDLSPAALAPAPAAKAAPARSGTADAAKKAPSKAPAAKKAPAKKGAAKKAPPKKKGTSSKG
jgi:soluble lytic murein transglycosylase